ncbi:MAG: SRPBCC family protein [Acidimicrobiales bacterium]|nr:SRPBCC family protein [Acidimicrobiales bacterium]
MSTPCERIGLDDFAAAPVRFTASETIAATPEQVFAIFLDAEAWTKWVFAITGVEWTSPFPLEVGSTRTVHMLGGLTAYEEFLAWEPGRRMAFRFNELSKPVASAFGEDYQVTDLGDGRSRVDWVMVMAPAGAGRHTIGVMKPAMGWFIRHTLANFRRYVEAHPPAVAGEPGD